MTITVTHATQATGTDAGNGDIRKTAWNEDHVITGAADLSAVNIFTAPQIISTGAATGIFRIGANAGFSRQLQLTTGSSARWILAANNVAESGSNAGSDFNLDRYDDSGVFIARPLAINRATGLTTLEGLSVPTIELGSSVTDTTLSRLRAGQLGVEGKAIPYLFVHNAVAASVGAVTTVTTLATITIPAGAMGPNGFIDVFTNWTVNNNANQKQVVMRVGGAAGTMYNNYNLANIVSNSRHTRVMNVNSQTSQKGGAQDGSANGFGSAGGAIPTSTVDTSAAWDLVITGQKVTSAADTLTLESYSVIIYYGA